MSRALTDADREQLTRIAGSAIRFDQPMSARTTLRIGGPADAIFAPESVDALQTVVSECAQRGIPTCAVGGGSNLLVRDRGIRGVVIVTRKLRAVRRIGDTGVFVEAGLSTGKLLALATQWELGGVEFLGGVPGSIGGGLIMNAGTYLGEFVDVTERVRSVKLRDGTLVARAASECQFVYRGSSLPRDEIVVSADLQLQPRSRDQIEQDVRALRARRKQREPHKVSNAGSFFKNPPGDYAGRLIETADLKGTRIGGALCSPEHANWLVNTGKATCRDMEQLIELVRNRVRQVHGVELKLEVKLVGED